MRVDFADHRPNHWLKLLAPRLFALKQFPGAHRLDRGVAAVAASPKVVATRAVFWFFTWFILYSITVPCHGAEKTEIAQLYQGKQCGQAEPGLTLITQQSVLDRITSGKNQQGLMQELSTRSNNAPQLPANRYTVLISAGQLQHDGYTFALRSTAMAVAAASAVIPLQFELAAAHKLHNQLITSPCIVISIPKEDIEELRVEGQPWILTLN